MSTASKSPQDLSLGISMVLNVVLTVGILALFPIPQAVGMGGRVCGGNPAAVTSLEVPHTNKRRDRVSASVEGPARVIRKATLVKATGTTAPMVSYIRCRPN